MQTSSLSLSQSFSIHEHIKNRIQYMNNQKKKGLAYGLWIPALFILIGWAACNQQVEKEETQQEPAAEQIMNPGQVDEMPDMEGGMQALMEFITKEVKYPEAMKEKGESARVMVSFVVKADGSVDQIEALPDDQVDDLFKEEAVRAVNQMPDWKPGMKDGQPVSVKMVLPISFRAQ
ncbi:MAG: energy transducer TonB [Bacteroidota bacterium]|nr:energy transducer TonB [Bacteroidota bacterium]MDX5431553.1 energy transducer TonB [Bacteroidota bacterium]MDX5470274.1 energy transducer TonB [Bacteroidota bacterium]